MSDGDALLRAVLEAPDDDAPRLVYADWLDEHGDPDRAEFIRDQVEWRPGSRDFDLLDAHLATWCPWFARHSELGFVRRQDRGGAIMVPHPNGTTFWRRGFIEEVYLTLTAFAGGPCGRCGGDGRAHGADRPFEGPPGACPACKGDKVTPGTAPALFAAQPVKRVVPTDVECRYHRFWKWNWVFPPGRWAGVVDPKKSLGHATVQAAGDALSVELVAYGRQVAGLPPLSNEAA